MGFAGAMAGFTPLPLHAMPLVIQCLPVWSLVKGFAYVFMTGFACIGAYILRSVSGVDLLRQLGRSHVRRCFAVLFTLGLGAGLIVIIIFIFMIISYSSQRNHHQEESDKN